MDWKERRNLASQALKEAERVRLFAQVARIAPIDPIETAIKCGCEVRFLSLPSLEGIYSPDAGPAIVLGSERPAGRRTYTCAHELGHHVFNHGTRFENINSDKETIYKSPEEFLADMFAAFLLMSQTAMFRTLKDRGWTASILEPEQVYRLANYFGVGYGTIINHLELSLGQIPKEDADELRKIQPKQIKASFGASANTETVLVDYFWKHRAVDLEIGDTLVLPADCSVDPGEQMKVVEQKEDVSIYKTVKAGISRAFNRKHEWAANIRISRKNYEGLAQYRFLEEREDDNE